MSKYLVIFAFYEGATCGYGSLMCELADECKDYDQEETA